MEKSNNCAENEQRLKNVFTIMADALAWTNIVLIVLVNRSCECECQYNEH